MELIVFWLMPVVLLVVLILLALYSIKLQRQASLYVVEPLSWLVEAWQVARFEPDNQTSRQIFKLIATVNLSEGTLLEEIIVSASRSVILKSRALKGALVDHQIVGPLAEQFMLSMGAKNQSVLVGPLEQIEEFISDEKIAKFRTLSQKSAERGYLALAVVTAAIHGGKNKVTKHQIEGLAVLEPKINQDRLAKLQNLKWQVRFLSVMPVSLAKHLYELVFPGKSHFGLNAVELATLLPPKFAEADLDKAVVVGEADLIARHQALRVWQQKYDCVVVSHNPEDRDLPVVPISDLPQHHS